MASSGKQVWKRASYQPFSKDCKRLNRYHQWMTNKLLDGMTRQKDPAKVYPNTVCMDCGIKVHLFGIRDGVGNDILEIVIYLDYERKVMHPLAVRAVQ